MPRSTTGRFTADLILEHDPWRGRFELFLPGENTGAAWFPLGGEGRVEAAVGEDAAASPRCLRASWNRPPVRLRGIGDRDGEVFPPEGVFAAVQGVVEQPGIRIRASGNVLVVVFGRGIPDAREVTRVKGLAIELAWTDAPACNRPHRCLAEISLPTDPPLRSDFTVAIEAADFK